jgi:hypothetical protein
MQKFLPLFFHAFYFISYTNLVPAHGSANSLSGVTGALARPAGAQGDRHAAQENIAERYGRFMHHGFHGFSHKV